MINLSLPNTVDDNLLPLLQELLRRAVDGTVGAAINGGDLKVGSSGFGLVIPNRSGTKYFRIIMDDDGVICADPL